MKKTTWWFLASAAVSVLVYWYHGKTQSDTAAALQSCISRHDTSLYCGSEQVSLSNSVNHWYFISFALTIILGIIWLISLSAQDKDEQHS